MDDLSSPPVFFASKHCRYSNIRAPSHLRVSMATDDQTEQKSRKRDKPKTITGTGTGAGAGVDGLASKGEIERQRRVRAERRAAGKRKGAVKIQNVGQETTQKHAQQSVHSAFVAAQSQSRAVALDLSASQLVSGVAALPILPMAPTATVAQLAGSANVSANGSDGAGDKQSALAHVLAALKAVADGDDGDAIFDDEFTVEFGVRSSDGHEQVQSLSFAAASASAAAATAELSHLDSKAKGPEKGAVAVDVPVSIPTSSLTAGEQRTIAQLAQTVLAELPTENAEPELKRSLDQAKSSQTDSAIVNVIQPQIQSPALESSVSGLSADAQQRLERMLTSMALPLSGAQSFLVLAGESAPVDGVDGKASDGKRTAAGASDSDLDSLVDALLAGIREANPQTYTPPVHAVDSTTELKTAPVPSSNRLRYRSQAKVLLVGIGADEQVRMLMISCVPMGHSQLAGYGRHRTVFRHQGLAGWDSRCELTSMSSSCSD